MTDSSLKVMCSTVDFEVPSLESLATMSATDFALLSPDIVGKLPPSHIRILTDEQLLLLSDHILSEVWSTMQLNALTSAQVAVLARILYSRE